MKLDWMLYIGTVIANYMFPMMYLWKVAGWRESKEGEGLGEKCCLLFFRRHVYDPQLPRFCDVIIAYFRHYVKRMDGLLILMVHQGMTGWRSVISIHSRSCSLVNQPCLQPTVVSADVLHRSFSAACNIQSGPDAEQGITYRQSDHSPTCSFNFFVQSLYVPQDNNIAKETTP